MLNYIIYSIAGLGIAFLLYQLLLKTEKSLHFNRFYLLGALVLCLISPLLELNIGFPGGVAAKPDFDQILRGGGEIIEEDISISHLETLENNNPLIPRILLITYLMIVTILVFRYLRNLRQLYVLIKGNPPLKIGRLKVIPVGTPKNPFSFFNFLFLNEKDLENKTYLSSVLTHETAHSAQFHSIDILLLELLSCFLWWNPFLRPMKKAVLANHEYLADAAVIKAGIGVEEYSRQLIQTGNKNHNLGLSSGFSFIQTKNRLHMLHATNSQKALRAAKILSVLTLFSLVFAFSSFTSHNNRPFRVVIDAGHGGNDPGSLNEKQINLQVALALEALSKVQEIEIILLRDSDIFYTLKERNEFIKAQNADLMLSLHCNYVADKPEVHGMEAFISEQSEDYEQAYQYSRILLAEQFGSGTDKADIKTANFLLLRDSKIPAITLHLGYLSNPQDRANLQDPEYQKRLAANLYEALLEIRELK